MSLHIYLDVPLAGALAAGKTVTGFQAIDLTDEDLATYTPEERAALAANLGRGSAHLEKRLAGAIAWEGARPADLCEATPATLLACVRAQLARDAERAAAHAAEVAQGRAQRERDRAAAMALPLDDLVGMVYPSGRGCEWRTTYTADALTDESLGASYAPLPATEAHRARHAEAVAEAARRTREEAEGRARCAAKDKADREALAALAREEEAAEKARAAHLAEAVDVWVAAHGTESQRARDAAGFLPEWELWAAIGAEVFAPLADRTPFTPLEADAVDHWQDCQKEDVDVVTEDAEGLTAGQFAALEELRTAAAQCSAHGPVKVEAFRQAAFCHTCNCDRIERWCALVTVDWHGHKLRREYTLPNLTPEEAEQAARDDSRATGGD